MEYNSHFRKPQLILIHVQAEIALSSHNQKTYFCPLINCLWGCTSDTGRWSYDIWVHSPQMHGCISDHVSKKPRGLWDSELLTHMQMLLCPCHLDFLNILWSVLKKADSPLLFLSMNSSLLEFFWSILVEDIWVFFPRIIKNIIHARSDKNSGMDSGKGNSWHFSFETSVIDSCKGVLVV